MTPPLFSVVIPTYNRASFIGAALDSIERQTYRHYETIVVDDGSTDGTQAVLAPYIRAGRVTCVRHATNAERACARNSGMAAARGDFLTFLDSDDVMYPTNLEDAAAYAASHPESRCFHNLYEFVDRGGRVVYRPPFPPLGDQLKAIAGGNFIGCLGCFIHRDVYTAFRFNTSMTVCEDWEFWIRVLARYHVGRIDNVNSGLLEHPGRGAHTTDLRQIEQDHRTLVRTVVDDPALMTIYGPYLKRLEASAQLYLATAANGRHRHREAMGHLRSALQAYPRVVVRRQFIRLLQLAIWGRIRRHGGEV